jgi:SAM-dependent methyltransferase
MTGSGQSQKQLAVFDRVLARRRRARAAATLAASDFLIREAAQRLVERLGDVRRRFPLALELGCQGGRLAALLAASGQVDRLIEADPVPAMLAGRPGRAVVADEELLPFGPERFDLVLSCFALHRVNDLPGTLAQIRYCLKPDGLFLAVLPGGATLQELRASLMQAELEEEGGASPRVAPFIDLRDAGQLLQRAGFALPVTALDSVTVTYAEPIALLRELRAMGESNILQDRRRSPLRRATLLRAAALYQARFADARGRIPATIELLTLAGWKPDPAQPQPLRPGAGQASLAKALGVPVEVLTGKAGR